MALFAGILCLGVLPFLLMLGGGTCGLGHSYFSQGLFWLLVGDFLILTWLGACPAEDPFNFSAQVTSLCYFSYYIVYAV